MRVGQLNKRITIQTPMQISDNMGGQTTVWNDWGTVWAAIWPVSAKEQVQNMGVVMNITHRMRIRYQSGVTHSQRVVFGTRYFDIKSIVNPEEKNEFLDLLCQERT